MPRSVVRGDEEEMVEEILQLFNHVVDMQTELGHSMNVEKLDKIYEKCESRVIHNWRPTGPTQHPLPHRHPTSSSVSDTGRGDLRIRSGVHSGRTFIDVYQNEKKYIKFLTGMNAADTSFAMPRPSKLDTLGKKIMMAEL